MTYNIVANDENLDAGFEKRSGTASVTGDVCSRCYLQCFVRVKQWARW